MAWMILFVAGLFEVVWASLLKHTHGWTRLWPSVLTILAMLVSFVLLAEAMKSLNAGTAYAVWVGIGAVGVAAVGVALYNEPVTLPRLLCISLIIIGIVGLKATSA